MADKPVLTTTGGNPVTDNQNAMTAGPRGPVFLDAECAWYGDPAFDLAF